MVVQTEFLVIPDTDVPLILGTPIMQGNQMSIYFKSRQLMMGTESSTVNLTFFWKTEKPGQVKVCGAESEFQSHRPGETETNNCPMTASEDEAEQICDLVKSDHETGLKILSTVATFRDVFALNDAELGQTHLVEHAIDTGDAGQIKLSPYRLAPGNMAVVKQEVDDMLSRNINRPSKSPYSAPIVLVTQKDGSSRMCVDFRKFNEVTRKVAFPLPRIDQIHDHLHGAKVFLSLDLASG